PLLSSLKSADSPFLRITSRAVLSAAATNLTVVLYPFGHFELLLFQMLMQAEASNLRHHRGSEANSP
ncbi:hypothetical protein K443DRAFT_525350, partial [Laccaria amethystina LaAM-08-1]